jgi:hypothetical protein
MKSLLYPILALGLFMPGLSAERDLFDKAKFKMFLAGMGSAHYFFHLDDRNKRLEQTNHWIRFNGKEYGLMLQMGERLKFSFPEGESWVVTPGGNRVPLLFKPMSPERLPGYWEACFSQPHLMVKGEYQYHVTVMLDGEKQAFKHRIFFDSAQIEAGRMSRHQIDVAKPHRDNQDQPP